ncbi:MAG TPA: hypothetical protein PKM78_01985 [Anaerolineae bacterium]|nr:hypothetical protein [Anaerolineae bacterium]HNU02687.1 hypothetical protein [Anaerolineae bacterium]
MHFSSLMPFSPPTAAQFFDRLAASYEAYTAAHPTPEAILQIGPCLVRARASTAALQRQWLRPLACPLLAPQGQAVDFAIDLLDLGEQPLPDLPWPPQASSSEQETSEYREGPFLFTRHGDVMLTALNQEEGRTVGLVHDPARWPLRHYRQAIFITLYQHLRRRGLHLIHASAIGSQGRAALIAGRSGAGKTTTMLTSVSAGLDFLGDDTTLVQRTAGGALEVITLLSTLDVTDATAAWFPELTPHLSPQRSHTAKRQIILSEAYPERMAASGQVAAILAPEITDQAHTALAPASRAALLSELLFFSVDLHEAALAREHVEFLAQAVESTPVYRLLLGNDKEQIPPVIADLLHRSPEPL